MGNSTKHSLLLACVIATVCLFAVPAFAQFTDMSVTKTDSPDPVTPGSNLTYTITVNNPGPNTGFAVLLNDTIPMDTTFVSFTAPGGWVITMPSPGGTGAVTASSEGMVAGTAVFTLVVNVNPTTTAFSITNVANLSVSNDLNVANNVATETTNINAADLILTKSDSPDPVTAGASITYQLSLVNNGPSAAVNVQLTDTVPAGTTLLTGSFMQTGGNTGPFTTQVSGTTLTATLASMPPGVAIFEFLVNVSPSLAAGSTITNNASVTTSTVDPNAANNSATETTGVVTFADLVVTKADAPDPVAPGTNLTYTIDVANDGLSDAQSVTFTDNVPANTTFVSFTAPAGWSVSTPGVGAMGTVTATRPTLARNAFETFTLIVKVDAATPNGTIITNTASAASTTTDAEPSDNSATATTTAAFSNADLAVTKSVAGAGPFPAGGNVTYTITVSNSGPAGATNVTATDTLPAGATVVSATPSQGSCSGTGPVNCALGSIASGASATISLVIKSSSTPGVTVNSVTVSATQPDPNPANNTATATVTTINPTLIPTLSTWMLLLLAVALAGLGLAIVRGT
jgi:uncharacterized repeat protein (TIGR01451 family)